MSWLYLVYSVFKTDDTTASYQLINCVERCKSFKPKRDRKGLHYDQHQRSLMGFCRDVKSEMFQKVSIEIFFQFIYLFIYLLIYFNFGHVALLLRRL